MLWGIFLLIPAIRPIANWLNETVGWIPFFSTLLSGPRLLTAAPVLTIMILPTVNSVPYRTKEVAYGMVTTHSEAILKVMVLTAAGRDASGIVLRFCRALSETMTLAVLIDNSNQISCARSANAGIPSPEDR